MNLRLRILSSDFSHKQSSTAPTTIDAPAHWTFIHQELGVKNQKGVMVEI
jgi:hypothetical protein